MTYNQALLALTAASDRIVFQFWPKQQFLAVSEWPGKYHFFSTLETASLVAICSLYAD